MTETVFVIPVRSCDGELRQEIYITVSGAVIPEVGSDVFFGEMGSTTPQTRVEKVRYSPAFAPQIRVICEKYVASSKSGAMYVVACAMLHGWQTAYNGANA